MAPRVTRSSSRLDGNNALVEGLSVGKGSKSLVSPKDPRIRGRGRGCKKSSTSALVDPPSPDYSPKLMASSPSSHRMSPNLRGREWRYSRKERKEVNRRGEKNKSEVEIEFLGYRQKARSRTSSENSLIDLKVLDLSSLPASPKVPKQGTSSTTSLGLGVAQILSSVKKEAKQEASAKAGTPEDTASQCSEEETHSKKVWTIEHLRLLEDTAHAQRMSLERKLTGRDYRSDWEIKRAEDSTMNMLRRRQHLREEYASMQGRLPSLSPCGAKGLRFKLTEDGDFVCKLSDKGPRKRRRRGKKTKAKNKSFNNESAGRKKRRRDKFDVRYSTGTSTEEDAD